MKTSAPLILLSLLLATAISQAAERTLEIRLLKSTGAAPSNTTLRALAGHPGAQLMPPIRKELPKDGVVKIAEITPFHFASEYNDKGAPVAFEMKEIGSTGEVTVTDVGHGLDVAFNFKLTRAGAPHVYDVNGVQVVMPVFQVDKTESTVTVKPGEWTFLPPLVEDGAAVSLAIRVIPASD